MQFEFIDSTLTNRTVEAGAQVFEPRIISSTEYATADMGNAHEITHLGDEVQIQIRIPYFDNTQLEVFESLCYALLANRTVTVSNPNNDILLMGSQFPFVARRRDPKAVPFPKHINTSCNNKFSLDLDLLIVG